MDVRLCAPLLAADRHLYPSRGVGFCSEPGDVSGQQGSGGCGYRREFSGNCPGGGHLCGSGSLPDLYQCSEVPAVPEGTPEGDQ